MQRSLARRFAPLMAVLAVQLGIIAAAPSRQPVQGQDLATGAPAGSSGPVGVPGPTADDDTSVSTVPGSSGDSTGPAVNGGSGGGGGGTVSDGGSDGGDGGDGGDGQTPKPTPTDPRGIPTSGDTSHCVQGFQFSPDIYLHPPQCRPKWGGGDNGGVTYKTGVDEDTIKVVYWRPNLGEAVDAILSAQGSNPPPDVEEEFLQAVTAWINDHYELWGRKIELVYHVGQCQHVPPDIPCLRSEIRDVVNSHKPFWVIINTSLCSACYTELSRLQVMNSGGWGFRDAYNQKDGIRPYHWDLPMGGTQQVNQVAEWYCKRMHGGGTAKAEWAGEPGPLSTSGDIRQKPRVLGVISTNDPENKNTIQEFKGFLEEKCGATVAHEYYYAQDITTAEQQRRAALAEMRSNPESTTIMCFCDLVAPIFLYQTAEENQYYPEHVIVGTGWMDWDPSGQSYDNTLPPQGRQFENAFGLGQAVHQVNQEQISATKIWRAQGGQGVAMGEASAAAERNLDYFMMVAGLLQEAGPLLTPANVEFGAFAHGNWGPKVTNDKHINLRSFNPGDYTWFDNMREIYWSTQTPSEFNGDDRGSWVDLNGAGKWFLAGQYTEGLIKLPPKPR